MAESESKFKKIFGSKLTLFLLILLFLWMSISLVTISYKKFRMAKEIGGLKTEIEQVEKNNQQISAMIDYLSSQSFLEREAKEKLNMKKEGEEVLIIEPARRVVATSSEDSIQPAPENKESAQKEDSNFLKWLKYFFK
ncbi:MAG: septum formation initiator family protein [Candidatus Portnoybacteria bacterium]|nr:septum formation initiator family protein [Candidatus Portnoybacteria bacterium]